MLETLDDGMLRFKIRNRDTGAETPHEIDVLVLRLACEELETRHSLQVNASGAYVATATFLADLATKLQSLGIAGCTPSVACQLWKASASELEALQKKTNETPDSPTGSESSPAA